MSPMSPARPAAPGRRLRRTTRRIPGLIWLTVFASPNAEPSRGWMYGGLLYRWCLRIPGRTPYGVGLIAFPESSRHPERFRGTRRATFAAKYPDSHAAFTDESSR